MSVTNPERIAIILAAIERRWREEPDLRLGELLVNVTRDLGSAPSPLFGVEDGELLRRLGPETEAERRDVAKEPAARPAGSGESYGGPRAGVAAAPEWTKRLRALYDAFNARDIDAVLGAMTDDVDWPNAWEGGRLVGKQAVRDYWTRQWTEIDPTVEPTGFSALPDGRIAVEVEQTVRDRAGTLLGAGPVHHIYTFVDGLVARMDVEPIES
jgi:hypothetical protein